MNDDWRKYWEERPKREADCARLGHGKVVKLRGRAQELHRMRFREALGPKRTWTLLDAGCGAGDEIIKYSDQVEFVVGVDFSINMLRVCRRRLAENGISNVMLVAADTLALPFKAGSFDGSLCLGLLQFLDATDVRRALNELCRATGERILLHGKNSFSPFGLELRIAELFLERVRNRKPYDYHRPIWWYRQAFGMLGRTDAQFTIGLWVPQLSDSSKSLIGSLEVWLARLGLNHPFGKEYYVVVSRGTDRSRGMLGKKVCHVTTGHGLRDDRIFHKEAVSLSRAGYRVSAVGPSTDCRTEVDGVSLEPVRPPGVRWRLLRKLILLLKIQRRLLHLTAHVHHCHEMDAALAALPFSVFGSRMVYDVHEHFPDNYIDRLSPTWLGLLRLLDRLVARSAKAVITVDEILKRKYCFAKKVVVIHNYPKADSYEPPARDNDSDLAVYVGGLTEDRGVLDMVEALAIARRKRGSLRLLLVGRFVPQSLKTEVESRIAELGLSDAVDLVEWTPFEKIPGLLAQAGVGLSVLRDLPRYRAAIPIKIYEYMAAGIPVIASDFEVAARLLAEEGCGVTAEPGSPESLSQALLAVVSDTDHARVMGRRGRKAVEEEYNWERESGILVRSYEEFAGPA